MANEKKIILNTMEGAVNTDGADAGPEEFAINPSQVRFFLNCRVFGIGTKGKVVNVPGNTLIPNMLPAGNNQCIGWGSNEEKNKFYWFNYNDQGNHVVYCYNDTNQTVIPILRNLVDTNGVDIMFLNPSNLINHVDIIQDNLIYWVDGLNKARKFNLDKAVDKTATGYGTIVLEDYITAYKKTAAFPILPVYFTDVNKKSNYLYANQFKFAQRLYYDDGEISNTNDFGTVPLPPNESYNGQDSITYNNNCINVPVFTGSRLVTQIEILVKILSDIELPWQSVVILNKAQLQIPDNSQYIFAFYNDLPLTAVDNIKVNRPYSYLPDRPFVQSFVKLAMTYGNFPEGFPTVQINATAVVTSQNLFLPSETTGMLNSPQFLVTQTSATKVGGGFLSGDSYWQTVTHFIIGFDVKNGNKFVMTGKNGAQDNYLWTVTADYASTAETIAAVLKSYLRSTNRGVPSAQNGISNEMTDGSGNVSWDYTYLGHDDTSATVFAGTVNPVNYSTLTNSGASVNVIKSGGPRKYAIVYEDSDGRKSLAYTNNGLLVSTPFITQNANPAVLQQPIHTISITNQPPIWAYAYYLVRTSDITDYLQMLIQQVTPITVLNEGVYLDLVIGSLYTYQIIHPDTILKYEFQRGDRVRLIRNENNGTYYPYFDTEVLSYKNTETQIITSQISCDGTDLVTPSDGPKTAYVGKNIVINGAERTIVSISGSQYVLNEPINPNLANPTTPTTAATYPSYTIIDRRGIIRIAQPDASFGITIANFSLVEIYRPQSNQSDEAKNGQYQNFQEFGVKYSVLNPGLPTRAHLANIQNQDGANPVTTPAVIQVTQGEAYYRFRALPTNVPADPTNPNDVQVIVDSVEDPNFSDFYASNLYSLGRVYPQDDGSGQKQFDQRERFSNNYIQDTRINGLNDFDNTDRKDYNDQFGAIMLSRFRRGYLFLYKLLHTCWTPVAQTLIKSNSGEVGLATGDKLLNDLEYAQLEAGIGNNPESWFESDEHQYYASANTGIFIRVAQDGSIPISTLYNFDLDAREFLSKASKFGLRIFGGFDKPNWDAIWSHPQFIQYLFNGGFTPSQWQTQLAAYPGGTTFTILQQPANSTATIVGTQIQITGTSTLGDDFFLFRGNLPGGGVTPTVKFCFTVVNAPNRPTGYRVRSSSTYCVQQAVPPPPVGSTINVNNTTVGFTIAFVNLTGAETASVSSIGPMTSKELNINSGTYAVAVKVLAGSGNGTLYINGTSYAFTATGIDQSQSGVTAPIIVEIDPA